MTNLASATLPAPVRLETVRPRKRSEDTASGCRAKAVADLERAESGTQQFRWRLESSAAAWTARADLLERLERRFAGRRTSAA